MIQNVIREMGGIAAYGIISVCLFFIVFAGALLWAVAQRRSLCERMRALPLEEDAPAAKESSHE